MCATVARRLSSRSAQRVSRDDARVGVDFGVALSGLLTRAAQACVQRITNLSTMPDKDLKEKCKLNGIATEDFNKVRNSSLIALCGESKTLANQCLLVRARPWAVRRRCTPVARARAETAATRNAG